MAEEQFQPLWSKEQLKRFTSLYEGRGHLLSPDYKQKIEQHASYYNVPFYDGEGSFIDTIKAAGQGFTEAMTLNVYQGDKPKTQTEAIAKNIGHLIGFAPAMLAGPLGKIAKMSKSRTLAKMAGIAAQGNKISPSMIAADYATKKAATLGNATLASAGLKNVDALKGAQKLIFGGGARNISHQAFHLGVASAAGTLPEILKGNLDVTMDAFMGGAKAGAIFGGIGNITGPALQKSFQSTDPKTLQTAETTLKTIAGSLAQGSMAAGHGATNPELVYEYLLGAYFGGNAAQWKNARAQKVVSKIQKKGLEGTAAEKESYKEWERTTGRDIESHPDMLEEPASVKAAAKELQSQFGDPTENLARAHLKQLAEEAGLKVEDLIIEAQEKTPEGFVDKGEYVDGRATVEVKESALKRDNYIATTGTSGDGVLAEITGQYGLPSINYVPFRGAKDKVVGLDRVLTEDQLQEANKHISKANKSIKVPNTKDKIEAGEPKMISLPIADMAKSGRDNIAKNYWAIKNAQEVYLVTEMGGNPNNKFISNNFQKWPAQFAKDLNKPLFVLDSVSNRWFKWNKQVRNYEALGPYVNPPKPSNSVAILGTNNLAKGASPNIYKAMHGWLGSHFKKRPIADEIQKRANAANKAKVKDIQDVFTRQSHIKEELKKLEGLEESDELIAHRDVLNKNLAETEQSLLKIEKETTTDFLKKAIQDHVKVEEEVAGVDEFGTEQTRTIYKKPLQITQEYFKEFWGSKAGIESPYDQRTAKLELSEKISDIMYNQFSEKGSKINRSEEAIKAIEDLMVSDYQGEDFQTQGFKLSEAGRGEIRQAITRENLGKAVVHLQSDGVNFFRMKNDANPVTRAGTRKLQNEPEKYIETVFKNITGDVEPMLFTLDHVTTFNEKRGFNVDMELSRFRSTDAKGYATLVKNASKKAAKEDMYVFGGASDKDRLYFIKYHPELNNLSMKDLIRSKVATSKDLRLSREQSKKEHDLTTEEHDKAFLSNVAYDLSMNGLGVDKAGLAKFMETNSKFVKGSAPFNKRAQIWFTNSYQADKAFVKKTYEADGGSLNANDKYNVIIVKDLQKELKDYGLNSLDNIQNPEHVDGAIIVPDKLIDVINRDFGVPESGQNKSFIVSPNAEHGALLGKYMMHAAGKKMSELMEAQGLHMIMQESAVKQRGSREIGDYDVVNGKLNIKAKTYEISPEDVRGSYSVYGNDHFFEAQRIPKQVMMNMLESVDNPMEQAVIDKAFDDIIGSRWRGQDEYNNKLEQYISDSANKPESIKAMKDIIDNIENISMRGIVDAIRNESSPQLAEAIYQKMLKVTKENIAAEHRDSSISDAAYKGYMAELTEFNSLTDRMIKQATIVSEEARAKGYNVTADAIYNHKIIRDFKVKAVQNFLVNSATKPHMGNSGAAYMRPYDKAMQVNLDKVNDLLDRNNTKGINKNDEIFFLDDGHASRNIHLLNSKGIEEPKTLKEVFNEFNQAKGDRLEYLTEVLTAATVRVPMDSVSGMQVMRFGGFTGRKGHGILLHSKAMRAEGGADLDGDKAFYYFGGTRGMSKEMKEQFYKNKNEFEYIENGESYTKDNKKAKISKSIGKFKKGTSIRELLISQIKTGSDKDKMNLANSATSHYAPAERIRISEAAVDGRNQLGPAVSNSQLMKGAYNSIVAAGGRDVLEFRTAVENSKGEKIWKTFKVDIKAKTSKEDVKFQRDMARAQLGLASDPMDELGLAGINTWKKLLWDSHFEAVNVKEKGIPGKSKYKEQVIEQLADADKLKFSYTNSGIFGDFVNLNKGLWGRDYTEGRKYNMDEIHNFLGSATNLMNVEGASNSFLPKIGNLFSGLDWSDSPFVRLNEGRIAQTYKASNEKIGSRLYLQNLLGRSSMKVPYTKQIQNIFKTKLFDSNERIDIASDIDRFYDAIKGTTYEKRAEYNKEKLEGDGGYKERLNMLNEMLKESEDFIVNDVTDMVTLNIVEDIMTRGKISPERFIEISKQVDYLKKNSYLMARDRAKLEAFIEEAPETELSKLFEEYYVEKFGAKPRARTSKDTSRTAEMDQSEIDIQIEAFRAEKGLNAAENELFDQLMLGSINRGKQLDKITKMESEIKNWKNGVARDYIKYLRDLNSKSNISRLGFSSMAIDDASIRKHLRSYMEMMNENSIPLTKAELNELNVGLGKTIDTPPSTPETIHKMATNTGFEHIDFKAEPVKSKELSSLIAETGELLKLHPNIVGDKSGKALNEFTRGLPFIRKDFDAMDIADIHKLNTYLKQTKEGTVWQRLKRMFGKDDKAISWRSWQQLPSTTNRELMATDIDLARKEGYFTDAQGEVQLGKIRVPTQFMDTLSNGIGNMIEMGTQVGDGLVNKFQEQQMFYQGLEEAPGLWEVAIRQREFDGKERYRATREEYGKSSAETEQHIIYMERQLKDAKKKLNWTAVKNNEYFVNIDGQRKKMTGENIIKRINKNLTEYMEEMHTIIRGKEEMRGAKSPYFVEWYDPLTKKSPKYNHNAFLKDLDIYSNGRVPKRWKGLMKSTNESIPSIFGIDGVRSMMREMHIDFMMQIGRNLGGDKGKDYIKKATKLASFPIKDTGQLPFENYFPRMFFEPSIVKENLKKANERIINDKTMDDKTKLKELVKIQHRHKRLDGDYIFEEMQDGELYDKLVEAIEVKDKSVEKNMENWFSMDASMGNMRSREYSTPGWSVAPTAVEAYVRSLSNTYFKGLAGMISRNIVSNPKTGIYKKLTRHDKWDDKTARSWVDFAKLYVNDALGNPVTITEQQMRDSRMALRWSPYARWADNRIANRVAKTAAKLGLKGIVSKDGTVLGGVDMYDLRKWSQMEAKFEMAALLAHPKSAIANLLGGGLHTIQSAGLTAYRNVHNYEYLQQINPKLKSRKDVDDMVVNHGVLPQWMIYELGMQKEFQSSQGKDVLKAISKIIKRDPNTTPEELTSKLKVALGGKFNNVSDGLSHFAAKFMTIPERKLRTDAFMAHYLKAWETFGGAIKDPNHPFLIEMGKKGVAATQFLYNAPNRPAYARTSLGKVMTRFQMYAWNSVKLRGDMLRKLEIAGYNPNSPEGREAQRFLGVDMFILSLANMFPYSLFENNLPQPFGWFQDTADWIFGNEQERDRAFFGTYPTAIAPLQAITPPIGRVGLIIEGMLNGKMERVSDYYMWTMFPFGRIIRDVAGKGGIAEAPIRLVDKLTGIPLTQIQRKAKRMKENDLDILYPKAFTGGYE